MWCAPSATQEIYISETPNTGDTFSTATAIAGQMSYSSDGGDCLGLAQSTDTADCQGTWTVPNLQPGRYTIMWWWEFNAGEFYNSCADVVITARPPPPPSPFAPAPVGQVWQGTIEFDLTVKYGPGDRRASAEKVAEAVQVALANAGYPVGNGASIAGPVKSVSAEAKANAGRRLQASDTETFTITVVALAPLLQPIGKVVRGLDFINAVQEALIEAGATSILSKETAPALAEQFAADKMGLTTDDLTVTPVRNADGTWTFSVDVAAKPGSQSAAEAELKNVDKAELQTALDKLHCPLLWDGDTPAIIGAQNCSGVVKSVGTGTPSDDGTTISWSFDMELAPPVEVDGEVSYPSGRGSLQDVSPPLPLQPPPLQPPPPPLQPPSLPPGATIETVYAKEVTLVLKAGGTVEEYEAKADSVRESLRQQLQCILPTCTLTVTVEDGSVILTVVATDTAGAASQVESAAVFLQENLDAMSSVLGITIEEVLAPPSAVAVQVQVTRLAPSPPPTSPEHCSVQACERNLAEDRAEYQQAVAAGQKDEQDGWCMLAGLLATAATDVPDCNCGIDTASFEGVSDCPDLHGRIERLCEKLRACADPDSGDPDSGLGLAIGLALGGCLLVAMLAAAVFVWHRKRRTQPPQSSASNAAPQQVEVIVTQPESKKAAASPESLSALLAACGLEHHEETFKAEGYTLDTLLESMKQGKEAVKSDLRELKLTLGECRQLINQLEASK